MFPARNRNSFTIAMGANAVGIDSPRNGHELLETLEIDFMRSITQTKAPVRFIPQFAPLNGL